MSCLLVSYACDIGPLAIHSVVENVASRLYKKQVSLEPQFSIWKPCRQRIAIKVPGRWGACSPTGWATACDQTPTGLTDLTIDTFTRWIVFSHYVDVIGMLWFWLWSCFIGFWARMRFAKTSVSAYQEELDQLHFEHQVLAEEASRLREAGTAFRFEERIARCHRNNFFLW